MVFSLFFHMITFPDNKISHFVLVFPCSSFCLHWSAVVWADHHFYYSDHHFYFSDHHSVIDTTVVRRCSYKVTDTYVDPAIYVLRSPGYVQVGLATCVGIGPASFFHANARHCCNLHVQYARHVWHGGWVLIKVLVDFYGFRMLTITKCFLGRTLLAQIPMFMMTFMMDSSSQL